MNNNNKVLEFTQSCIRIIERCTEFSGKLVSWLVLIMVLLVSYDVAMRYIFNQGSVAIQELEWHLFALIFLLGAAYTLKHDEHVRLDLFYQSHFSNERIRAWINLVGSVVFLIPFCLLIINSSWFFVLQSWSFHEGSPDPGGLPHRWLLKASIPVAFALLFLQAIAEALKNIHTLSRQDK